MTSLQHFEAAWRKAGLMPSGPIMDVARAFFEEHGEVPPAWIPDAIWAMRREGGIRPQQALEILRERIVKERPANVPPRPAASGVCRSPEDVAELRRWRNARSSQ